MIISTCPCSPNFPVHRCRVRFVRYGLIITCDSAYNTNNQSILVVGVSNILYRKRNNLLCTVCKADVYPERQCVLFGLLCTVYRFESTEWLFSALYNRLEFTTYDACMRIDCVLLIDATRLQCNARVELKRFSAISNIYWTSSTL